ncbi:hypothetical protein GGER_51130 [Serratia rubidaea]
MPGFCHSEPLAIRLFRCGCGFDDHGEGVGLQRCAAYQRAVDVRLGEQFCGVFIIHGTAVLNDDAGSDVGVVLGDVVADKFVYRLSLRRGRGFAGADGPDRLIGNHGVFHRRRAQGFQHGVNLTCANFFGLARFVFRFGFTDAQHRGQAGFFQYREFLGDHFVALFVIGATLRVADDDVLCADVFQHVGGNFTGKGAGQVHVYVLGAQRDAAAGQLMLGLVQVHDRWRDGYAAAFYAAQFVAQAGDQLVNHVRAAVQLPVTHH